MKKITILVLLALLVTAFAFAAENFVVERVDGTITHSRTRAAIKAGDTLTSDTPLTLPLGSSIELRDAAGNVLKLTGRGNMTVAALIEGKTPTLTGMNAQGVTQQGLTVTGSARAGDQAAGLDDAE